MREQEFKPQRESERKRAREREKERGGGGTLEFPMCKYCKLTIFSEPFYLTPFSLPKKS